jgi:predicted glycosyltransferase
VLRIALYAHDTFGLGHLNRCLKLADALAARLGPVQGLIVTGSPWARLYVPPAGFSYVQLPEVVKCGPLHYRARDEALSFDSVLAARTQLLESTVNAFEPDLLVVDNIPCGLMGEALPALRAMKARGRGRIVLSLRDIIDEEDTVKEQWQELHAMEAMSLLYDEIWIFGLPEILDSRLSYGMASGVARKTVFCGYLGVRSGAAALPGAEYGPSQGRLHLRDAAGAWRTRARGDGRPLVLVTGGGGGDAGPVVETYLEMIRSLMPPVRSRIILGPDFPEPLIAALARRWVREPEILRFVLDLPAAIACADVTVSMAGYNTFSEILALGGRSVLIPRVRPRQEQWIRARAFHARQGTRILHPDQLTPDALWESIESVLRSSRPSPMEVPGGRTAAERAATLLGVGYAVA